MGLREHGKPGPEVEAVEGGLNKHLPEAAADVPACPATAPEQTVNLAETAVSLIHSDPCKYWDRPIGTGAGAAALGPAA